jgi:hypothetical protein
MEIFLQGWAHRVQLVIRINQPDLVKNTENDENFHRLIDHKSISPRCRFRINPSISIIAPVHVNISPGQISKAIIRNKVVPLSENLPASNSVIRSIRKGCMHAWHRF